MKRITVFTTSQDFPWMTKVAVKFHELDETHQGDLIRVSGLNVNTGPLNDNYYDVLELTSTLSCTQCGLPEPNVTVSLGFLINPHDAFTGRNAIKRPTLNEVIDAAATTAINDLNEAPVPLNDTEIAEVRAEVTALVDGLKDTNPKSFREIWDF